jgi:signal transduction histidine kinase
MVRQVNNNPAYSSRKRGNSILLRLTSVQVWKHIVLSFKINVTILLIAVTILFFTVNYQAGKAIRLLGQFEPLAQPQAETAQYTTSLPGGEVVSSYLTKIENEQDVQIALTDNSDALAILEQLLGFSYYTRKDLPSGFTLPQAFCDMMKLPRGTIARLEFEGFSFQDTYYKYVVVVPTTGGAGYAYLAFDLVPTVAVFLAGFFILLSFQFLIILFGIFGIRRSTKRILRPIGELTAVAQIINNAPQSGQKLKLDGAIDTLNAITEDHLDTRIAIDDEREELKGLALAINAMLDRLDAAYQAQLRFVSDASHELRTPIAVVQGYANLLDRWGKRDEKALQESIDAIKAEAEGMENLVDQLLFLARSDNNTLKTEMRDLNLSAIAEEIIKETAMIDESHTISGTIDENLLVYGDGQLLKQAIRIFVDNAIKYTPVGGRIRLATRREGDMVVLSVSDNGIGIAEKDLPQVFERFFRADESRARKTGGTGLGLAIAKNIVDRHGGYMDIISRENIGTKISAALPAKKGAATPKIVERPPQKEEQRPEAV